MGNWSWILGAVGVTGLLLAGRRVWWGWTIALANEALWIAYAIATDQYGFIAMAIAYAAVYARNTHLWRTADSNPAPDAPQDDDPAPTELEIVADELRLELSLARVRIRRLEEQIADARAAAAAPPGWSDLEIELAVTKAENTRLERLLIEAQANLGVQHAHTIESYRSKTGENL